MHEFSLTHADYEIIHSGINPDNECQSLVWARLPVVQVGQVVVPIASSIKYAYS